MDWGEGILRGAIRTSWVAYAAAVTIQAVQASGWPDRSSATWRLARWWWPLWVIAWAGMMVHGLAALHVAHHWSLQSFYNETARQTGAALGFEFGGGIYFSLALLALWTIDIAWGSRQPMPDDLVAQGLRGAVHGYVFFIVLNGVVTFQQGWYRWTGAVVLAIAAWGVLTWIQRRRWALS